MIEELFAELVPDGALELVFASEIVTATWRLRRYGLAEGNLVDQTLIDPMEDEIFKKKQRAIDRARAQAHHIIRRSMAELRKLQTERATRREVQHEHVESALVDSQKVGRNVQAADARQTRMRKRTDQTILDEIERVCAPLVAKAA